MTDDDLLSLRAAAAECAPHVAIATATAEYSFADLARRAAADHAASATLARPLVATASLDTLVAIYRALDAHAPLALLHPRLPTAELARQRALLEHHAVPADTAFVLFTSGSTAEPRGIVISRAAVAAAARAHGAAMPWRDDDRWLLCLPLAHAGGLAIAMRCLAARKPIVLAEGDFDPARVAQLAASRRATLASLVPTQLLDLQLDAAPLRAILLGGAAAPPNLPPLPIHLTYGLTETFGQIATARAPGEPPRPLPGVELATAAEGRLRVRAPMLATRYLDGTPIAPEFTTSDLGAIDPVTGALHIAGRADELIISGGEKIQPTAIEAVLVATPGVRAACAFGIADARWGQIVGAALVTDAQFEPARAETHWRDALPPHARPRRLAFVRELPLLPNGKLDRRRARQML